VAAPGARVGPAGVALLHLVNDTRLDERTEPRLSNHDGDHERFAHYVKKTDILSSAVNGHEVEALCGKRWIPSRDPKNYPVCPECQAIHSQRFGAG
jgi:hypothetical protein